MPTARGGVLDLSGWDLRGDGPVRLDGQWEARWEQLVPPGGFDGAGDAVDAAPPEFVAVPGPWAQTRPGAAWYGATGAATFRLRVLLPPNAGPCTLRLMNVAAAYTLWANGRLAGQAGQPGLEQQAEQPALAVAWTPVRDETKHPEDKANTLELVLQVSNHNLRDGGVATSLWLGSSPAMQAQARREAAVAMFLAGTLFIMAAYHVALFFFRRSNISPLLFALYCLQWLVNYVCSDSSGWAIRTLLPGLPVLGLERFALVSFILSVPTGYAFLRSLYPQEFSRLPGRLAWAVALGCMALAGLAPFLVFSRAIPAYYILTMGLILFCFVRLFRAWRGRKEGAGFTLAGFIVLGLVGFNDMLSDMRILSTPLLLAPGMLFFILSQAFALSQRLSKAFSAVETLSVQLDQRNQRMEAEMAERRRLEREIVSISEEERRRMSVDLHDGLCQLLTAARLRCAALRGVKGQGGGTAELGKLSELLDELVREAYDLSHGLWPMEHDPQGTGPSLAEMVQRFTRSSGMRIQFTETKACAVCPSATATQLFRIAQEALANATKHSQASAIQVAFSCTACGDAVLSISDNGIGRARAQRTNGGLGMGIMAHRARIIGGLLRVEDAPGGGTLVTCTAPCDITAPRRHSNKETVS